MWRHGTENNVFHIVLNLLGSLGRLLVRSLVAAILAPGEGLLQRRPDTSMVGLLDGRHELADKLAEIVRDVDIVAKGLVGVRGHEEARAALTGSPPLPELVVVYPGAASF